MSSGSSEDFSPESSGSSDCSEVYESLKVRSASLWTVLHLENVIDNTLHELEKINRALIKIKDRIAEPPARPRRAPPTDPTESDHGVSEEKEIQEETERTSSRDIS